MPHFNILRDHTEIVEFIILNVHDLKGLMHINVHLCAINIRRGSNSMKFDDEFQLLDYY